MKIPFGTTVRGESGVADEGKLVGVQKFHSWCKCTTPLTNIQSDLISNISSSLCINLHYVIYVNPLILLPGV